jgi:hypothetical protein
MSTFFAAASHLLTPFFVVFSRPDDQLLACFEENCSRPNVFDFEAS